MKKYYFLWSGNENVKIMHCLLISYFLFFLSTKNKIVLNFLKYISCIVLKIAIKQDFAILSYKIYKKVEIHTHDTQVVYYTLFI